jgi:DDE superfamily endonuclease
VKEWFSDYRQTLDKYGICKPKNILNMDESGARVGCPTREEVVVPIEVKEMYTSSPENRKSLTIIETIKASGNALPPLVICPGKQVMDNWIHDNLTGEETITNSPTSYTNNTVIMQYLDHLLIHTGSGPTKPWKMLLLDGHITYEYPEFVIKAAENHIVCFEFPSHLTHALQLLQPCPDRNRRQLTPTVDVALDALWALTGTYGHLRALTGTYRHLRAHRPDTSIACDL